jgi:divalent metal cation (Fe/Co/Zn/Cd) transporter
MKAVNIPSGPEKTTSAISSTDTARLYRIAFTLALFTIFYNTAEGLASTYFGFEDESFTLFGFGVDSFIEAVSGFGIASMVRRIQKHSESTRSGFERASLQITGSSFFVLAAGLIATGGYNVWTGHAPATTRWGVLISVISIAVMGILVHYKNEIGNRLDSPAIVADAQCTKVCIYMSLVLLAASGLFELFKIPYLDAAGLFGLAYFSFKEGRECFEKAENEIPCACGP